MIFHVSAIDGINFCAAAQKVKQIFKKFSLELLQNNEDVM